MATVRELITKWGFKVEDSQLKRFEKNLNSVKTAVKVIGGLAVTAAGSMFGMAQSTAKAGDEIAKTARVAGIGVEAFQELRFSADLAGISSAEYATSMRFLTRNISEAAAGTGEAKDAFKRLGIQLRDERTGELRKTEDVFLDLAEGFKNTKSQADRVSFAMDILGRSGAKMSNMLVQGKDAIAAQRAELRQLGILTEEDTKIAEDYIDAQARLGASFNGIKFLIGSKLLPVIIKYTDKFRKLVTQHREFIRQRIDKAINVLANTFKKLRFFVSAMWKSFENLTKFVGGTENAIKLLAKAFAFFIGLKLITTIGGLVQGFFSLMWAIRKVGVAATLTNLKIMAIPLAIGAAFIGAVLIIQDFLAFLRGDKTVIGGILAKFGFDVGETRKQVKGGIDFLKNIFSRTFDDVITGIKITLSWFVKLFKGIKSGVEITLKDFKNMASIIKDTFLDILPTIKNVFSSIQEEIKNIIKGIIALPKTIKNAFSALGRGLLKNIIIPPIAPATQPFFSQESINTFLATPVRRPSIVPQNISINSPITITVPQGTDPDRIVPIMEKSFRESFGEVLRETNRQVAPAHD